MPRSRRIEATPKKGAFDKLAEAVGWAILLFSVLSVLIWVFAHVEKL